MNFLRIAVLSVSLAFPAAPHAVMAQTANPLAGREDKIIPAVLLWMQETGVKLTYLGNEGGTRGYIAESAQGSMQTVYVTPDGKHVMVGLMFDENWAKQGGNITGKQLLAMRKRYNDVADAVSKVTMDDKGSLQEALAKIKVDKPAYDTPKYPEPDDNSEIAIKLREAGYKLTVLGDEGGVRGYFSTFGRIQQPLYITPDGKHFVVGFLLQRSGKDVTGVQIGEMRVRFDQEGKASPDSKKDSNGSKIDGTGEAAPTKETPVNATPAEPAPAPSASASPAPAEPPVSSGAIGIPAPKTPEQPAASNPDVSVNIPEPKGPAQGEQGNPSAYWQSSLDKASFYAKVKQTAYFDVGSATAPTTLYMIADPNCPYCHQTWDYIRKYVNDRQVRVRVILIAFLPGSQEKAIEIMASSSPGLRYLQSDAGRNVKIELDAKSDLWRLMAGHLESNKNFATNMNVTATPFLAYEDRNGQFYASEGVPTNGNFDAFFAAAELNKK